MSWHEQMAVDVVTFYHHKSVVATFHTEDWAVNEVHNTLSNGTCKPDTTLVI